MGRQEEKPGALGPDYFGGSFAFVEGDIVEIDNVGANWVSTQVSKMRPFIGALTILGAFSP